MDRDPALTPERIDALNAVDLRLFGVTHGITEKVGGITRVRGGSDDDFSGLRAATNELTVEHGDALAIEPTGFMSPWVEDLTLANVVPASIPEGSVEDMPPELRAEIAALLEAGRATLRINNLVYAAAHTLLRGVPVHRAEVSRDEWKALEELLPELGLEDVQNEIRLFYRNTKMLKRLGAIAVDITTQISNQTTVTGGDIKPILLFGSGKTHTTRLGERLHPQVAFTSNQ